ncbi:hypothetical protein [Streptomyces sp. NPDC020480]|uniref:hypothetical protein n=1 Tax=Streptomyces sp. NPDC020480 TaxID=3365076 RepID=UPI00378D5C5A
MLDADLLNHPVVRDCVDALVDGRGGLVVYGQGLGGRETLVAAAVRIATTTGKTLTIVDAEPLREATAHLATQLGMAEHTFLSPAQAASWPTGFDPDGVLAVHGDVLRNQDMAEPLRAAARDASLHGHLVVARHPYGSNSLDTYTTQHRQITTAGPLPAPGAEDSNGPHTPGPITRRVQPPSRQAQAQQIREPTWMPHETDLRAEAPAQERAAEGEPLTPTTRPTEPTSLSKEVLDHGRFYQAASRHPRRTQPDPPDPGPVSFQPDSDRAFWITEDRPAGRPDTSADLEAKHQFLAALSAAEHTGTAQDPQPSPATHQAHSHTAPEDPHARLRDRLAPLLEQSRTRLHQTAQALGTPLQDRHAIAPGPPSAHDLSQRQATDRPQHDTGPRPH